MIANKVHIYSVNVKYYDHVKNKESSSLLIYPFVNSEYIEPEDIKKKYTEDNIFSNVIDNLLTKEGFKDYTKESFKFIDYCFEYRGYEKWWLTWFAHHTYNKFDSEMEAFSDFQDFLESKGIRINYCGDYRSNNNEGYCAMGGEDRYRWVLCKCEHCLKRGITTITH